VTSGQKLLLKFLLAITVVLPLLAIGFAIRFAWRGVVAGSDVADTFIAFMQRKESAEC
jgi:hypothetical protein